MTIHRTPGNNERWIVARLAEAFDDDRDEDVAKLAQRLLDGMADDGWLTATWVEEDIFVSFSSLRGDDIEGEDIDRLCDEEIITGERIAAVDAGAPLQGTELERWREITVERALDAEWAVFWAMFEVKLDRKRSLYVVATFTDPNGMLPYRSLSFEAAALTYASALLALKSRGFIGPSDYQQRRAEAFQALGNLALTGDDKDASMASVEVHPERIDGPWVEGFVLDRHVISSRPIGYMGEHMQFETTRSALGELVYQAKYRNGSLEDVAETAAIFARGRWDNGFDCVVAPPPSSYRTRQPALLLAEGVAQRLGIPTLSNAIVKAEATQQMKNVPLQERGPLLTAAIQAGADQVRGKRVLIVDDVWETGSTLRRVAEVLGGMGATDICVLVMTRTK